MAKVFLRKNLAVYATLLCFYDPVLADHLLRVGLIPDMYAPAWLLTLFSRVRGPQTRIAIWSSKVVRLFLLNCSQPLLDSGKI